MKREQKKPLQPIASDLERVKYEFAQELGISHRKNLNDQKQSPDTNNSK